MSQNTVPYVPSDYDIPKKELWVFNEYARSALRSIRIVSWIVALTIILLNIVLFAATLAADIILLVLRKKAYNSPEKPRTYGPEFGVLGLPFVFTLLSALSSLIPLLFVILYFGGKLDFSHYGPGAQKRLMYSMSLLYFGLSSLSFIYYLTLTIVLPIFRKRAVLYWAVFCTEPGFEGEPNCPLLTASLIIMNIVTGFLFLLQLAQIVIHFVLLVVRFKKQHPQEPLSGMADTPVTVPTPTSTATKASTTSAVPSSGRRKLPSVPTSI